MASFDGMNKMTGAKVCGEQLAIISTVSRLGSRKFLRKKSQWLPDIADLLFEHRSDRSVGSVRVKAELNV
jgi:hypothetical protein